MQIIRRPRARSMCVAARVDGDLSEDFSALFEVIKVVLRELHDTPFNTQQSEDE